jgi:hypothetical protein
MRAERRRYKSVITVLVDPNDDKAVQDALREHCSRETGRLLISPASRACSEDALAGNIYAALGVWDRRGRRPTSEQLFLDGLAPVTRENPEQLELFSVDDLLPVMSEREIALLWLSALRELPPGRTLRKLKEAVKPMRDAGITELYVLRAHAIQPAAWALLADFADQCGINPYLVVHGRSAPDHKHLAALAGHEVTTRSIASGDAVTPWWKKQPYRRAARKQPGARPMARTHVTAAA